MQHHRKPEATIVHDPEVKHYHVKISDGWVPLPPEMQTLLGWKDGDDVECVAIYGNQIVVRRKGALKDGG